MNATCAFQILPANRITCMISKPHGLSLNSRKSTWPDSYPTISVSSMTGENLTLSPTGNQKTFYDLWIIQPSSMNNKQMPVYWLPQWTLTGVFTGSPSMGWPNIGLPVNKIEGFVSEWVQGSGQGSNPIVDWMRCFRSFEPYPCIIGFY